MRYLTIISVSVMIWSTLFVTVGTASDYEIIFKEGAYTYDTTRSETDTDNKYLAQVIIKKDGVVINEDTTIKGSTIPDSWFFYEVWHGEGHISPPTDEDIERIFSDWENITPLSDFHQLIYGNFYNFIFNITQMVKTATYIPVIFSGSYRFKIGLHKNGHSRAGLGLPDVPRLIGSYSDIKPYDGRIPDESLLQIDGGYIRTINKNINSKNEKVANGINIHDGRHDSEYTSPSVSKFSSGCLTINPNDWDAFNNMLPGIEDWVKENHTGTVTIIRQKSGTAEAPNIPQNIKTISTHKNEPNQTMNTDG